MLKIENLCYKYDTWQSAAPTINNINFEVQDNKILAIMGISGSGKSTLAKLIAGLITPLNGKILLDGENIFAIKNLYSKIGIAMQNPEEQFFCRTVYDEFAFTLKNFGYDVNKINERIANISDIFEINSEIMKSPPFNLSLGNQRKCAVACATVLNPKLLILDEPTSGLDSKNRINLIRFVKQYKKKYNCSVIIISHDIELAVEVADEIIVLQNGEKILQDTLKNIFSNHENPSIFGLKRTQVNEIVQLVNLNKKYLNQNILTVDEAIDEIIVKTHHKRGLNL